jgi:hypothetical protein
MSDRKTSLCKTLTLACQATLRRLVAAEVLRSSETKLLRSFVAVFMIENGDKKKEKILGILQSETAIKYNLDTCHLFCQV